jgi:hypothetical protein
MAEAPAGPQQRGVAAEPRHRSVAAEPRHRSVVLSGLLTLLLMLLVAAAVGGDQGWGFSVAALAVSGLAIGGLYLALPVGPLFGLGTATGLAVYMCLYVVIGRSAFPGVVGWALPLGFLLPVACFVAACWVRRRRLARLAAEGLNDADLAHLPRFARWLLVCAAVAVVVMGLPLNRLGAGGQTVVLLLAQGLIGAISAWFVRDVVRLLVDIAAILSLVSARLRFLAVPIATYITLFSLVAVGFGCLYRIADGLSRQPLFEKGGALARLDFSEALHFSVVTLSTVGYGDILPRDDGIRLLAATQMLTGQLLLLFGFAEIMRSRFRGEG